jgi:N-methylhydantoinase A
MSKETTRSRLGPLTVALAVDIGGTFTDVVLRDSAGKLWRHKLSTSVGDEAEAVVAGAMNLVAAAGIEPAAVGRIVHGSTIGTNAILERSGPRVGLVTTKGFRDVLEIARIRTPKLYDLTWRKPEPLVPRRLRFEVAERIGAGGEVVVPLAERDVRVTIDQLRREEIVDVAVCFINAPTNAEHERSVRELFRLYYPEATLSISSDVLCELKEYERTSTTVINAYLRPVMQRYLDDLQKRLHQVGLTAPLRVMRSDGGMMSAEAAGRKPIYAVISGPAAGVVAAQAVSHGGSDDNAISFDMGGTTAKASIIEGGGISKVNEYEVRDGISTPSRFIKAGGYLVMAPAVDLAEVGNGAGSLARVDVGGALRVGPESAGAVPGPACYGRGGAEPTITDSNVVLGYLHPTALLAGALPISRERAEEAIRTRIAEPLDLELTDAAWGIHVVANSNMIRAIRAVTVERGRDPRSCTLVAFGGSGPVHAAAVAREMGIRKILVPRVAGLLSAVGLLHADVEHHVSRAWLRRLTRDGMDELLRELRALERTARSEFGSDEGGALKAQTLVDLRYVGQATAVTVAVNGGEGGDGFHRLVSTFEREYQRTYRHKLSHEPIEAVTLRAIVTAVESSGEVSELAQTDDMAIGVRQAYFGPRLGFAETSVIGRFALRESSITGPALIDEYDTTIVVPPDATAKLTASGDVVLTI